MDGAPVSRPILWLWRKSWDMFTTGPKAWESASACSWDREGECWEMCGKPSGWKSSCGVVEVEEEDEAGLWMADTGERWEVCGWDCREEGLWGGVDLVLLASLTSLSWALWKEKGIHISVVIISEKRKCIRICNMYPIKWWIETVLE